MQTGKPNMVEVQVTKEAFDRQVEMGNVVYGQFKEDVFIAGVCQDRSEKNCDICIKSGECPITLRRELG